MAFKQVLEYFVAHLEYVVSGEQAGFRGYDKYIAPLVAAGNFKISGQGYQGNQIQNQLPEFSYKGKGLCITVQSGFQRKSEASYLNWLGAWTKIVAKWDGNRVTALAIKPPENFTVAKDENGNDRKTANKWNNGTEATLDSLGLFDGSDDGNDMLRRFLEEFYDDFNAEGNLHG